MHFMIVGGTWYTRQAHVPLSETGSTEPVPTRCLPWVGTTDEILRAEDAANISSTHCMICRG